MSARLAAVSARTSGSAPRKVARKAPRRARLPSITAPEPRRRTALQRHVDFFDTNHDGRVTVVDTYDGFRRLGFGIARSIAFATVINAGLGPSTSRAPTLTIDTEHIHLGRHGSDTGIYDAKGRFSERRFDALFSEVAAHGDGALDASQLSRRIAGNRTDLVGHVASKVEFALLMEIAGESRGDRRVLTRDRLARFYDGSLLYEIARDVQAKRAGSPAGRRSKARIKAKGLESSVADEGGVTAATLESQETGASAKPAAPTP